MDWMDKYNDNTVTEEPEEEVVAQVEEEVEAAEDQAEEQDDGQDDTEPKILTDVPIPAKSSGRRRASKWGFLRTMEVGEVAHFRFDDKDRIKKFRSRASSSIHKIQNDTGKSFSVRTTREGDDTGLGEGIGIWRLE